MSKHEPTIEDLDRPYEPNSIGLSGIIKFAVGLFILIVVTFALMKFFYDKLEENAVETNGPASPMAMKERQQLPPEPRLQSAPGFGVESPNGRVNMELAAPQAEWRELIKQWDEVRKHGNKDPKTGAMTSMPLEEAKTAFLGQNAKAKSGPDAEKLSVESRKYISDASSGRVASATRR
jgi:hypothetical protein